MYSLEKISNIIKSMDNIYILTHVYPDGDALGSAYALGRILQQMGKNVSIKTEDKLSENLEFIKDYIDTQEFKPDNIISVDLADTKLLHTSFKKYSNSIDLSIDHHITNTNFAKINYIDSSASATAEIIYDISKLLNSKFDKKVLECIYIGISTDTGCFKYSNTNYKSHKIASEIMEQGLNVSSINEKLFIKKSKNQIILNKIIYDNIEFLFNGKCALTFITLIEMKNNNLEENECFNIASIPIQIEGIKIGITLKEISPNNFKVSVRTSGNNYNSILLSSVFGGGGHFKASGFSIKGSIQEVKNKIAQAIKEMYGF